MPIRLKSLRRQEQQISKIGNLMSMFNVNPNSNSNYYQPVGGSSSASNSSAIDPKIANTKDLFEMFHLAR